MQMYNGMTNRQRAQVLVEALPYIQKYNGKIVVVKYGGNAMINEELKHDVMRDMVLMSLIGVKMVLVHGGGPEISSMLKRVGKETEFIDGLRVTDEERAKSSKWCWRAKSTNRWWRSWTTSAGARWASAAWTAGSSRRR